MIVALLLALQLFMPPAPAVPPCTTAPAADTLNGSPPTAPCYTDNTATRPTVVQAAQTTTDSSASWTVTWKRPFVSSTPYVHAEPIATGLPINCTVITATATTATGKCYQTTTTTLGGSLTAIIGTVISPVVNSGANLDIRVIGRETTQ